jgi:DNA-binding response OmpR family regulator
VAAAGGGWVSRVYGFGKSGRTAPRAAYGATSVRRVSEGLVLVVEDEPAIAELQRRYLAQAGFGVHVEAGGLGGLDAVRRLRPVLVVLDVGLPDLDGVELCRRLRDGGDWTPVLFVTARVDEVDRVLGLEIGGDDYLTKPFSPREMVARVRAVLRRGREPVRAEVLEAGPVRLDPATREVSADGVPVALTATEFNLLEVLLRARGRVLGRSELLAQAWGQVDYGTSRTVDVHVAQLRAKLGAACPVETVRGVGYRVAR